MSEQMRNWILLAAVVLTIGSCLMAINSSQTAEKIQKGLDTERYNRMVVEEKLDKAALKIVSLETELENAHTKIQGIQAIMDEGQSNQAALKEQLESVGKLKESLEKRLQEMQANQGANGKAMAVKGQ